MGILKAVARAQWGTLLLLGLAQPAFGQPDGNDTDKATQDLTRLSLEDLMALKVATVYGASKYEQKVTEAPAVVTIVTSQDIQRLGYRTLADILRSMPGVYTTYDRNYSFIGVRGIGRPGDYNGRVLLLLNGYRINDNIYDQAYIGTDFLLDVDLIDRVEMIRGPGSSIYGGNAFMGVVNVITRTGQDSGAPEISAETGSFGTHKERFSYGRQLDNGLDMLVSASSYRSDGPRLYLPRFDDPSTNHGIADGTDYDDYENFFGSFSLGGFNLQVAQNERTKGLSTGILGTRFSDPRSQTVDRRSYLSLRYDRAMHRDTAMTARLSYDTYGYDGIYVKAAGGVNHDETRSARWSGEMKFVTRLSDGQRLVYGAEYTRNLKQDQRNFDTNPVYASYLDDRRKSHAWGIYAQDEIAISRNWRLHAGLRHDRYSDLGGTTNPRLAAIYTPDDDTAFKVMYGTAFRPPNVYERYYNDSNISTKAAPNLKPERVRTYEFAWEQNLAPDSRFTASVYHQKIRHLITFITDPADSLLVFSNAADVQAQGIELSAERRWSGGMEGKASYTLQRTRDSATGSTLSNSPRQLLKFTLTAPVFRPQMSAGIEVQYTSSRRTITGSETAEFWLANVTLLQKELVRGLNLSAGIYNLFDSDYDDPVSSFTPDSAIRQDERNFRIKLDYRF